MNVVICNPRNAVSAVRLGLPVLTELGNMADYTNIINWGRSDAPDNEKVINKGCYVAKSVDKAQYLKDLNSNHVSCPPVTREGTRADHGSWVLRPNTHEEGNDFHIHNCEEDGSLIVDEGYHATRFISPTREYRIWFAGNRYMTAKRIPRPSEDETDETCRSKWGYRFVEDNFPGAIELCNKARQVVPLQFGAFDILWATEERKWYILEVNSAPSLDHSSVRSFMVPGIKFLMRPDPAVGVAPRAQAIVTPSARRRIKVMTMAGWEEIEV